MIDSRACEGGRAIRRRRECLQCAKRFTTYERIEENVKLTVIKRDLSRVPWDREKIFHGLERACFKRAVTQDQLRAIVDDVEEEIFKTYDREVPSMAIGELVAEKLRRIDQVSYVRFASVWRNFRTVEELMEAAQNLIIAKQYEDDPTQGKLFIDGQKDETNGKPEPALRKGRQRVPAQ